MHTITFTCEVITPMFLAGADGQTPEIRPASIKGAMRFWWRAMHGDWELEELKVLEDAIFGGVGKSSIRSKILIQAGLLDEKAVSYFNFEKDGANFSKGTKYLHYTFYNHYIERLGYSVGTKFYVKMSSIDIDLLQEVSKSFGVLSILGGLGTRSRRGAGAFKIVDIQTEGLSKNSLSFYDTKDGKLSRRNFVTFLKTLNLSKNKKCIGQEFSNLSMSLISYKKIEGNWEKAISHVGNIMSAIRKKQDDGSPFRQRDLNKKAAFGLPINVREEDKTVNLYVKNESGKLEEKRRASPIYITVNKVKDTHYLTVTKLSGRFMPKDSLIIFKKYQWGEHEQDESLLDDFWDVICDEEKEFQTIKL